MIWARMLAYITGTVDQELLLRNELCLAKIESAPSMEHIGSRTLLNLEMQPSPDPIFELMLRGPNAVETACGHTVPEILRLHRRKTTDT